MKTTVMKKKIKFMVLVLLGLAPYSVFAAENSIAQASGISDLTLLVLMLSFVALLLLIIQALSSAIKGISKSSVMKEDEKSGTAAKVIASLVLLGSAVSLQAADGGATTSTFMMTDSLFWMLATLILLLAVVIFILFRALLSLIKLEKGELGEEVEEKKTDLFESLKLTDRVAVEEESSIMLDHDYDGIKELDNNLPPWWVYMFYATIIFAVVYLVRFHITGSGQLSHEEYAAEMEAAVADKAEMMANATESITEDNVVFLVDAPTIDRGAAIYKGNCATCHGQLGEGGAGPNLTDEYWIHGGSINSIFKTIKYGVPQKGMIAWQSQFSPSQMQQVSSYIKTLVGTNPPNAKDPQGEVYVEEIEAEPSDTSATENDTMKVVVEMD
jgi:cytochrome c oxidase cbb3-type subunit 3